MELRAEDITIAITVYSRRDYICDAIQSALNQTVPVKVMVVEDCGPDPALREFVLSQFGSRITYYRNAKNRGLFDNWNACLEYCQTAWLSILHDDDLLRPEFVATMLELGKQAPGRSIYFGRSSILTGETFLAPEAVQWPASWRDIDVRRLMDECFLLFPGQLFCVDRAKALGGFRPRSYFTGDWDMWFRLSLDFGGAQSIKEVSIVRSHDGIDRGTSVVVRKGWKWALDNVQRKRNLAFWREKKHTSEPFERAKLLRENPIATRLLLPYARNYTHRIRAYNWWLFIHSRPPHLRYALFQMVIRIGGPALLKLFSQRVHR